MSILEKWQATIDTDGTAWVVPDGCCDVIHVRDPSIARWVVTDVDVRARRVPVVAGQSFVGARLVPGHRLNRPRLAAALRDRVEPFDLFARIDDFVIADPDIDEAIVALSCDTTTVERASRHLGVSARTLQRHFERAGVRPPVFWRRLARVRRAARRVGGGEALATVSATTGFSDQAHMTREFRRWFSCTPREFSNTPELVERVRDAGL